MLLERGDSARIAKALEIPQLHTELERAIWQVRGALESQAAEEKKAN